MRIAGVRPKSGISADFLCFPERESALGRQTGGSESRGAEATRTGASRHSRGQRSARVRTGAARFTARNSRHSALQNLAGALLLVHQRVGFGQQGFDAFRLRRVVQRAAYARGQPEAQIRPLGNRRSGSSLRSE